MSTVWNKTGLKKRTIIDTPFLKYWYCYMRHRYACYTTYSVPRKPEKNFFSPNQILQKSTRKTSVKRIVVRSALRARSRVLLYYYY